MTEVLALDPSISSAGVALARDGTLVAAERIVGIAEGDVASRALYMAHAIRRWWIAKLDTDEIYRSITLVTEWPQVYRAGKSKGDPNDLLGMAAVVGAVAGLLRPAEIVSYTPREWIGSLPKSTRHSEAFTSARGVRIMAALARAERALVPRYHDAVDAVGVLLKYLGRLEPRRVFARRGPCDCGGTPPCSHV